MLFALSAPPTNFYPAVLLGLGALFVASARALRARRAAFRAWLWATSAGLVGLAFVPGVIERFTPLGFGLGVVALVLLSAFQALSWAIGVAAGHALAARGWLGRPLAFGLSVLIAISLPTVFGWTPAGLVSPWPVLVQLAELIGERGVSLIFAVSAALCGAPFVGQLATANGTFRARRFWLEPLLGAVLFGLLALYGVLRLESVEQSLRTLPSMRVGVVQAAVPARLRWDPTARELILDRLRRLTIESESRGAALTIWPEAAYPYVLPHAAAAAPPEARAIVGRGVRGPVLAGLITSGAEGAHYNAATLVTRSTGMQTPQAKLELLWFGETIPLADQLPFLRRIFFRTGGLVPGDSVVLLRYAAARIGVLNCYEDTLPGMGRRMALSGANLLVNVTNDAWFGPTSEPELHLRLSALRAVETRLDLVRAVNLGVPAWIDAGGVVRARGSDDQQSVLFAAPALNDMSPTLYTRAGDIPIFSLLALATLTGAFRARRRGRLATGPGPSEP